MKNIIGEYYNNEEQTLFREVYFYLSENVCPLFQKEEWRLIKTYVKEGVVAGAYKRDQHNISLLLHNIYICRVLYEKVGLKQQSLLSVMLYPLVATQIKSLGDIKKDFGEDTAHLIECMTKVKSLYAQHDSIQDENFRKFLVSFAEDVRVIISLICDRYALMKMLNHTSDLEYRNHVIEECRCLYTPIAHRLGLYAIKSELEDMTVKYEQREVFDSIARQLHETKASREAYIKAFIEPVEKRIKETTDINFTIKGRTKSISSILHKLQVQNTTIEGIYDLFAIRIIIDAPIEKEKSQCWQIYSIITDMYTPNPKRLKDWLSIPKSNGYESLHITVSGPENKWVEVQIRSKRMDEVAERGLAAHWKYKGIKSEGEADQVMAGIRDVLEHNTSPIEAKKDFAMELYQEEIFVFTPSGEVRKLPKGATVLDFAFNIHSRLGMTCVGARVGHRNVKINYQLKSGDTVEILTNPQQTPKLDWLSIVATSKARNRIKQGIKEIENREAETGKELLQRRFKNRKIEIEEGDISKIILKMGFKIQTHFYHALSIGEIDVDDVLKTWDVIQAQSSESNVPDKEQHKADEFDLSLSHTNQEKTNISNDVLVIDKDLKGIDYKLAGCCHPIYGDDVVGFISVSGGIRIHREDCINIKNLQDRYPYRIVRARWSGKSGSQYSITLRVIGQDDIGIVSNISSIINKENGTLLRSININSNAGLFSGQLTVLVSDLSTLTTLIKKIKTVRGVKNVERVN
ncbi:MAG: bifunctional (p)ppGpp synthetase/guanosine-3',5'-bis(diphosphate) 3'-pyrophosphohydrolase [Bacteroidales bacterium]|nr:bifunctional (p)ppGpp synthetase/guanosine-3',5'-bis(diphosphate) 3'-pyrophosphohydrolase [Bacteroidales bacterium]